MLFIDIRLLDILDIILVALLLYQLYLLIRGTVAINIFIGVAAVYLFWKLVEALQMQLLSEILGQFIGVGVIALIIVFQQELRKFLLYIGTTNIGKQRRFWKPLSWLKTQEEPLQLSPVLQAAYRMAERRTGALIVFARSTRLGFYAETGDEIDATISTRLLESIFNTNSPLHDGAVIIQKKRIMAARTILPISDDLHLPARFGLRHRAAVGITERTDAVALVVSEESGKVSYAADSELFVGLEREELEKRLKSDLGIEVTTDK